MNASIKKSVKRALRSSVSHALEALTDIQSEKAKSVLVESMLIELIARIKAIESTVGAA